MAPAGEGRSDEEGTRDAGLAVEGRDFATGKEGRGPVGGAIEGRDGLGSVVVMVWWVATGNPQRGLDLCWMKTVDQTLSSSELRHCIHVLRLLTYPGRAGKWPEVTVSRQV